MDKQMLFEYIRDKDVVIWAGAGFSKYAGYSLGGQLRDLLYQHLSDSKKQQANPNIPLDISTEEFVWLKVDKNYRIIFCILNEHVEDVDYIDYH